MQGNLCNTYISAQNRAEDVTSIEYIDRVLYISCITRIIYSFSTVLRLISAICPSKYLRSSIVAGSLFRFSYFSYRAYNIQVSYKLHKKECRACMQQSVTHSEFYINHTHTYMAIMYSALQF